MCKRVYCCRERRRICKIKIRKILDRPFQHDSRHRNINHLIYFTGTNHLNTDETLRSLIRNHFDRKQTRARIIMCLVIYDRNDTDRIEALFLRLYFCQSCSSDIDSRKTADSCS